MTLRGFHRYVLANKPTIEPFVLIVHVTFILGSECGPFIRFLVDTFAVDVMGRHKNGQMHLGNIRPCAIPTLCEHHGFDVNTPIHSSNASLTYAVNTLMPGTITTHEAELLVFYGACFLPILLVQYRPIFERRSRCAAATRALLYVLKQPAYAQRCVPQLGQLIAHACRKWFGLSEAVHIYCHFPAGPIRNTSAKSTTAVRRAKCKGQSWRL